MAAKQQEQRDVVLLTTEELLAIARRSPCDPYRCSLRERLAWRELARRGDPAFRRRW